MSSLKAVVAVFDSAVQAYAPPMCVPSTGLAVRSFTDEVNRADVNNPLHGHPEDFELRHLANFDEDSGVFSRLESGLVEVLVRGKDVKR